jgi:hypothetical protein
MELPKFLLANNNNHPDDIFVIHTGFPRVIINLKDDEIEFFEDVSEETEDDLSEEIAKLIEAAGNFYDKEMEDFE